MGVGKQGPLPIWTATSGKFVFHMQMNRYFLKQFLIDFFSYITTGGCDGICFGWVRLLPILIASDGLNCLVCFF